MKKQHKLICLLMIFLLMLIPLTSTAWADNIITPSDGTTPQPPEQLAKRGVYIGGNVKMYYSFAKYLDNVADAVYYINHPSTDGLKNVMFVHQSLNQDGKYQGANLHEFVYSNKTMLGTLRPITPSDFVANYKVVGTNDTYTPPIYTDPEIIKTITIEKDAEKLIINSGQATTELKVSLQVYSNYKDHSKYVDDDSLKVAIYVYGEETPRLLSHSGNQENKFTFNEQIPANKDIVKLEIKMGEVSLETKKLPVLDIQLAKVVKDLITENWYTLLLETKLQNIEPIDKEKISLILTLKDQENTANQTSRVFDDSIYKLSGTYPHAIEKVLVEMLLDNKTTYYKNISSKINSVTGTPIPITDEVFIGKIDAQCQMFSGAYSTTIKFNLTEIYKDVKTEDIKVSIIKDNNEEMLVKAAENQLNYDHAFEKLLTINPRAEGSKLRIIIPSILGQPALQFEFDTNDALIKW